MTLEWLHRLLHDLKRRPREVPVVVKQIQVSRPEISTSIDAAAVDAKARLSNRKLDKESMDRVLLEINVTLSILNRDAELLLSEHPDV